MSEDSIDILVSSESITAAGKGPCWDGYKQVGMKEKNGKMVPNCVPVDASDDSELAAGDPCWDGYKQVGMKKGKGGKMVPNCVPTDASDDSEFANKKRRSVAQTPAPKKDRIKGSSVNKKGSASGSGKGRAIKFSASTEKSLSKKVADHNKKVPKGRRATLGMLKAVYRRGAGAFSGSHRPGIGRDQWAMGRVNAFLRILKSGKPARAAYTQDNDLLPASHPRSTKKSNSVITASALVPEEYDLANALLEVVAKHGKFNEDETGVWAGYTPPAENDVASIGVKCANCIFYQGGTQCQIISLLVEPEGKCRFAVLPEGAVDKDAYEADKMEKLEDLELIVSSAYAEKELYVELSNFEDYESPEEAILALTEYSGFGYEAEHAIRASWLRAVRNNENPYKRASLFAQYGYESLDADLLPVSREVLG